MPLPVVQPPQSRVKGPDGTDWATADIKTVWPGAIPNLPASKKITVDCTIEAIEKVFTDLRALGAAAAKEKVDATYVVLVRPGDLRGGATSPAAGGAEILAREILSGMGDPLDSFGRRTWAQNVLVFPEKGYGTVRLNGQAAFVDTRGITWAGFPAFDPNNDRRYNRSGYELRNVKDFGFGWCETSLLRVNVSAGQTSRNVELFGFGWEGKITRDGDYGGLGINKTGTMTGLKLNGFIIPPVYHYITVPWTKRPSEAHSDGWQIQSGPNVTGIVYRKFRAHASTNTAFQNGGYPNLFFELGQIVGTSVSTRMYPFEDNEATDGNLQAFNGSGTVISKDMDIIGSPHAATFLEGTTNTKLPYAWGGKGKERVQTDTTLLTRTPAQVFAISPKFDAAYQQKIFTGSATPPPVGDRNPPSTVVLAPLTVVGTTVSGTFSLGTDDVAVAGYEVERDGEIITPQPITGLSFEDRNRTPGSAPTYRIITVDTSGNRSAPSNARTATILPIFGGNQPPTVRILTTFPNPVRGDQLVEVEAIDDVAVTAVSLWSGPQQLTALAKGSGNRWTVTLDSERYGNRTAIPIEAHATDGTYERVSETVFITIDNTPDDPGAPLDKPVPKVSSVAVGAVVLSWPTVAYALSYSIRRRKVGETKAEQVGTTTDLVFIDSTGIEPGTSYVYTVTALGYDKKTSTSDEITATTLKENETMRLATVTGHLTDAGLDPLAQKQVRLKFELSGPATQEGRLIVTDPKIVIPNADGSFAVDLVETTLLEPASWFWVSASWLIAGQASAYERLPFKLRVPRDGGAIGDLLVTPAPPGVVAWGFGPPDRDYPMYVDLAGEQARLYLLGKEVTR